MHTTASISNGSCNAAGGAQLEALKHHSSVEVASFRAAVQHELRRLRHTLEGVDNRLMVTMINVVDSVVGTTAQDVISFYVLLLERATSPDALIDPSALSDRAALLKVRQALGGLAGADDNAAGAISFGQCADDPRTRGGVRWSAAVRDQGENSASSRATAKPGPGSKLSLHALEALRGSVAQMEEQQLPGSPTSPSKGATEAPTSTVRSRRTSARASVGSESDQVDEQYSSPEQPHADNNRIEEASSASFTAVRKCSVAFESGTKLRDATSTRAAQQHVTAVDVMRSAQPKESKWDIARGVFMRNGTERSGSRRATILRSMASEPGADEQDIRQMQMLRRRSGSFAVQANPSRRIMPIVETLSYSRGDGDAGHGEDTPWDDDSFRTSSMSSPFSNAASRRGSDDVGNVADAKAVTNDAVEHAALPGPTGRRRSSLRGARCDDDNGTSSSKTWTAVPPSGDGTDTDGCLDATPALKGAAINTATGTPRPRRGSMSDLLFARGRRASVSAVEYSPTSRRGSTVASRRGSLVASRRGSLADMYLSMRSSSVLPSAGPAIPSLAAFLLSDVSAEPAVQMHEPKCSFNRRGSRMCRSSAVCSTATPRNITAEALSSQIPTLRSSFLGAVSGEAEPSGQFRASLMRMKSASSCNPINPSRRASTSSNSARRKSVEQRAIESLGLMSRRGSQAASVSDVANCGKEDTDSAKIDVVEQDVIDRSRLRLCERRVSAASSVQAMTPCASTFTGHDTTPSKIADSTAVATEKALDSPASPTIVPPTLDVLQSSQPAGYRRNSVSDLSDAGYEAHAASVCFRWRACLYLVYRYDQMPLLVIHPLSRLRLYWDALVALLSLWSMFEVPLRIVFDTENRFGYTPISSINYLACAVFLAQPLVELRTILVLRAAPEDRPSVILWHYIHSRWLVVDGISATCPLIELMWSPYALACAVRLFYALRFVHKIEKATKTSPSVVRSVQSVLGALPALHWFACVFCYLSLAPNSWLVEYQRDRDEILNTSDSRVYLYAIYWTLDTASTRGSGEINVTSDIEAGLMCVVIALSTLLYSAIIANMSTLLLSSDATWNDHRRRVDVLKAFMRHRKLPTRLRQRIQNYLDYSWATQKGINESQILQELPATLQKQVTLFCAKHVIDKVPLFRGSSPDVSASIIASLVSRIYVPHDLIIESGARGDEFFILSEGVAVRLDDTRDASIRTPLAYLHAGSYFGELSALLGGRRHQSILALTHCVLYSLNHAALEDILHRHPECIDNLLANMVNAYDLDDIKARLSALESEGVEPQPESQAESDPIGYVGFADSAARLGARTIFHSSSDTPRLSAKVTL